MLTIFGFTNLVIEDLCCTGDPEMQPFKAFQRSIHVRCGKLPASLASSSCMYLLFMSKWEKYLVPLSLISGSLKVGMAWLVLFMYLLASVMPRLALMFSLSFFGIRTTRSTVSGEFPP